MPRPTDASSDAVEEARRLYRLRRMRDAQFGTELFGEPAWDLLLDLYIARSQNQLVSPMKASAGAIIPSAAAVPYIPLLREHGLVEPLHAESPISAIAISNAGFERMTALLTCEV